MKLKVEGSILLSKINKEHAIYLISTFNEEQIANMYDVSVTVVRDRIAEKIEEYGIPKDLKKSVYKPEKINFEKKAFSECEDDYGYVNDTNIKHIITKKGLLIFEGNAPIKNPVVTPLAKIIEIYKESIDYEKRIIETDGSI